MYDAAPARAGSGHSRAREPAERAHQPITIRRMAAGQDAWEHGVTEQDQRGQCDSQDDDPRGCPAWAAEVVKQRYGDHDSPFPGTLFRRDSRSADGRRPATLTLRISPYQPLIADFTGRYRWLWTNAARYVQCLSSVRAAADD